MRFLADQHISPRTCETLRVAGHDVVRVSQVLPHDAADSAVVEFAGRENRVIVTQDLDYAGIIALRGQSHPSLITLRLHSSDVDYVSTALLKALPLVESDLLGGAIVLITDDRIRRRRLPLK